MKIKEYFRYIITVITVMAVISLTACDSFLELDAPKTELITPVVFSSNSTANAAMLSIYARMATANGVPSREIPLRTGLLSDEFVNYSTNQQIIEFYTNRLSLNNSNILSNFWTPYFNLIFQCNAILEGIENNNQISEAVKKQLNGEAKFIRAYYNFLLVNLFGDIPIIETTDYRVNAVQPRSERSTVYQFIVDDLMDAKALLNESYVGADGTTIISERVRPNKSTAEALLSKVYLYMEDYTNAEKEATEVINNTRYTLPTNLSEVFLKTSTEAIWQLQPYLNNITTEADMFGLTGVPSAGITKFTTISAVLINIFDSGDTRKTDWIGTITNNEKTYSFPNKYKIVTGSANTTEYSSIFRLAELYLIRSEARIQLGNIENGIADLNKIRLRANVQPYDWQTVSEPLSLVAKERQRELFSEGHRWFDLIRTGKVNEVMADVAPLKGSTWTSTASLLPIPQLERDKNSNLTQNNGY